MSESNVLSNRYEFVMLFDVENGNPNGDPDAGNSPRIDPETNYGFVTDVCIKRKIRNYIELVKEGEAGYNILIKPDKALNDKFAEVYSELSQEPVKSKSNSAKEVVNARKYMCKNFYDVRTFGAVMTTGDKDEKYSCGIVRGPVQINFAKSISPIFPIELTISRQAVTKESDRIKKGDTTLGKKSVIPYALYRAEGYVSACLANKVTEMTEGDLELLWEAIINMFENDHSAARGKMRLRKLYVFKHESMIGNAPSGDLFDKIVVTEKPSDMPPRTFSDYEISVDRAMPLGVNLIEKY